MKNSIKYLLLSAAALAAVSCESWLDVTPPSEIRAEDHYSSAEGFQQTLIGCYLAMGETDLYGENLTWHMVEMLGRQYDARKNTAADDYDLDRYNYKTTKSTEVIEKVWEKSYSVIANVNDALDHIDRRKDGLDSVNYRIITKRGRVRWVIDRGRLVQSERYGRIFYVILIPDEQMARFRFMLDYSEEAICMNSSPLARGEKVRVVKGPLTGLVGELVSVDGKSKIAVRLNMLGCACVDMPIGYVESADIHVG